MTDGDFMRILTINSGSSSIKFALYRMGRVETQMLSGSAGGIGFASGLFHIKDEELMIARHTYSLVMKKPGGNEA
jgi:acetate kinase